MGKPSSTRRGPNGDIQRPPKPTERRRSPKAKELKELPTSKNATPRRPYCSMIGNRISALITAALSPPVTSVLVQLVPLTSQFDGERGAILRSLNPRIEFMPPRK